MSDASSPPGWAERLHTLQSVLATHDVDAFVVSSGLNITYLTGFAGSAGLLVVTPAARVLIVDGRYQLAAREDIAAGAIADLELECIERRYDLTLGLVISRLGAKRVGFEGTHVTVSVAAAWGRSTKDVTWVPLEQVVESQRMIKDAREIATLRRGARLLARAAAELPSIVRAGRTEREVAAAIDAAMAAAGFERPAFPTIVASGPNSAHPHAKPGTRALARADLVVLDFGGVLDGYCVDLTRMAAIGQVGATAANLFDAVYAANAAAIARVRPGVLASTIDAAARDVLHGRGFGEAFSHSTGHGLGLEVHEAPRIGRPDPEWDVTVQAGMVFTIEPGAYVEDIGGVRLEDDVLVSADGCEVLTDIPRDLLVI